VNTLMQPSIEAEFRPMQTSDLDAVMAIEPTIYSHPWTRGNFADSLRSGHSCWVMIENDDLVGYALMYLVLDEAHLLNISVAKAKQGLGLGRRLLAHMIDKARGYGARNMFLEVRPSNKSAIALYEDVGFNEMSVRRNYYPAANGREDAILMGLAL